MPSAKTPLKVYLNEAERQFVADKASRAGLSMSAYAKRICLGYEIKSRMDQQTVLALIRTGADFGRLGGLLKNALKEGTLDRSVKINRLLDDLAQSKTEAMAIARNIAYVIPHLGLSGNLEI